MIQMPGNVKLFPSCVAISLVMLLAACGAGGGRDAPAVPSPPVAPAPDIPLAPMVDSMGRQLPEAEFGRGDALAAGADGIAFDAGPIANVQVTLTDSGGIARTTGTDGSGYYRVDIKGLRPPFIVKARRADGTEWFAASSAPVVTRGFVPININGLTDKTLGYVADALSAGGGAASAVTAPVLSSSLALLDAAKVKLRTGLAIALANAGFDAASYDPAAASLVAAGTDRHAAFLRALRFGRSAAGRTTVVGTIAGNAMPFDAQDVAVDGAGNLYVADLAANSIFKIDPAGVVTSLAGSGAPGYADGVGAAASFDIPEAIAPDVDGNLYVADTLNHAIRKVTAGGVVSTLAGGAGQGFADGIGSAAKFRNPRAIAVDRSGTVYVTDDNFAVRRITAAGVVTTIAGYTPTAPWSGGPSTPTTSPNGIAVDSSGNVYYGDVFNGNGVGSRIVKITPAGVATDLYKAPPGANSHQYALAVDAAGTVYVGDGSMLLKITAAGEASTLAGAGYGSADGHGTSARFVEVSGIAVAADGNLFIADRLNASVRKVTPGGDVTTVLGKRPGGFADGPATSALFSGDYSVDSIFLSFTGMGGVAVDSAGDIYLADTGNHAIRRIARSGAVTTVAGSGARGFANGNGRSATFNSPISLALDGSGNIYVADTGNRAIRKISPSGDVSTLASGLGGPSHVAVAGDGTVYVSDAGNAVRRIDVAGVVSTLAVSNAQDFYDLGAIAVDAGGTVLVKASLAKNVFAISGDGVSHRITKYEPPWISTANGMGVDGSGNVYYLLWYNTDGSMGKLIRRSSTGVETEIAFDPIPHLFDYQDGHLAVDANGNVVVVDPTSSAIRIVLP